MIETGLAQFGDGQYGVLTTDDLLILLVWSIQGAEDSSASQVRKLGRRILPLLPAADLLTLAWVADEKPAKEWQAFAASVRELANRPPFKQ